MKEFTLSFNIYILVNVMVFSGGKAVFQSIFSICCCCAVGKSPKQNPSIKYGLRPFYKMQL